MWFALGVKRMETIKNEIRGTAQVKELQDKVKEARLRRDSGYIGKRMLERQLPKEGWMDAVREDIELQ